MNPSREGADVHMDVLTLRVRSGLTNAMALVLTAVLIACDSSPTAPSVQSATDGSGQVFTTAVDPGLPQNAVTLKATAPGPTSPVDGAVVNDPAVELTATSPVAVYDVPWEFDVRFEIYASANPEQPVFSGSVPQGPGTTSQPVPANVLQDGTAYVWRVRAESDGAVGSWSVVYGFTTSFVKLEPPILLAPVGGIVVASLRPTMTVLNGAVTGDAGTVSVELQISLDSTFANPNIITLVAHTRASGETNLHFREDTLLPEMEYFWRGRSTNRDLPDVNGIVSTSTLPVQTAVGVTTDWSATRTFRTPSAGAATAEPSTPGPPPSSGCCPPPNRFSVVLQVAAETGYPNSGISVLTFTQLVAERLHAEDANWGRYVNSKGNLGKDTVGYRINNQNDHPYKIDIVLGAGGSDPKPRWGEEGIGDGSWRAP